jgi:uncharacterized protein YcfL
MKKVMFILFVSMVMVACSSTETKVESFDSTAVDPIFDSTSQITDSTLLDTGITEIVNP